MIWLVIGCVVIILAILWYWRRRTGFVYLLRADISTVDGYSYTVVFNHLHPEAQPVEYVWLCLLFAAKMLYNIGNDPKQKDASELLLAMIAQLGRTDLVHTNNLVAETEQPVEVVAGNEEPRSELILAKLAFINLRARHIWTSIPLTWFEFQFPHSFLALVQSSLPMLNMQLRQRLQGSLARMAELYSSEFRFASRQALTEVPHEAFWNAKIIC